MQLSFPEFGGSHAQIPRCPTDPKIHGTQFFFIKKRIELTPKRSGNEEIFPVAQLMTRCTWANRHVRVASRTTDVPPSLFTEVLDIPHGAAKPEQSQRGQRGFSDTRLMSSGSCGQKQHSEEEARPVDHDWSSFLCCDAFFCAWMSL